MCAGWWKLNHILGVRGRLRFTSLACYQDIPNVCLLFYQYQSYYKFCDVVGEFFLLAVDWKCAYTRPQFPWNPLRSTCIDLMCGSFVYDLYTFHFAWKQNLILLVLCSARSHHSYEQGNGNPQPRHNPSSEHCFSTHRASSETTKERIISSAQRNCGTLVKLGHGSSRRRHISFQTCTTHTRNISNYTYWMGILELSKQCQNKRIGTQSLIRAKELLLRARAICLLLLSAASDFGRFTLNPPWNHKLHALDVVHCTKLTEMLPLPRNHKIFCASLQLNAYSLRIRWMVPECKDSGKKPSSSSYQWDCGGMGCAAMSSMRSMEMSQTHFICAISISSACSLHRKNFVCVCVFHIEQTHVHNVVCHYNSRKMIISFALSVAFFVFVVCTIFEYSSGLCSSANWFSSDFMFVSESRLHIRRTSQPISYTMFRFIFLSLICGLPMVWRESVIRRQIDKRHIPSIGLWSTSCRLITNIFGVTLDCEHQKEGDGRKTPLPHFFSS